ncbi:MAG: helix-turn-helix transcriptional regulator [Clostridia bacterium]|nr:helix-turn-helix transcriptional regulator [Clostridia bacterium]
MIYSCKFDKMPEIHDFYRCVRNTVWQIADRYNILIFVTDGKCHISCDGEEYDVSEGEIFFIPAGHSYVRRPIDNAMCTMHYIHFTFGEDFVQETVENLASDIAQLKEQLDREILRGETNIAYPDKVYLQNKNTPDNFEGIMKALLSINLFSEKRQLMCKLQSAINLSRILADISQKTLDTVLTDRTLRSIRIIPPHLKRAIGYISSHYSEQISLENLSEHCNVSKQQMIRYFKSAFGVTPVHYITDYKLSRAKELLFYHTELTIKEIALELGFDNQSYFCKVFSRNMGESPSAYRERTHNFVESE